MGFLGVGCERWSGTPGWGCPVGWQGGWNLRQILWLMFQVAEAGVLAWGDLITLGRLDDLENQIIVLCLQELGWCNSRGEISSTGMFILFSMKYTVVFIYPCRPQTSPACWFTLPGPLASPRGWWCHRFLSNFHSETLVEWRFFFYAPLQDNITWTVRAAQETYDWNWDSEEVEQLCFNSRRKRKWKWIGPIQRKSFKYQGLGNDSFHPGCDLPASQPCSCAGSFKFQNQNMEVYLFRWSVFKTWFQGEALSFDLCR